MDDVGRYNQKRWRALVAADALFTRPQLGLNADTARSLIDPIGLFGDLTGKDVLCLAGGGGQQSAAFALLGARVTVVDLSEEQLVRDDAVAKEYDVDIRAVHADMRDLSVLAKEGFDLVHQPYSLNFVPDCVEVFRQVKRVLRVGGLYWFSFANPFTMSSRQTDWSGSGYLLGGPYIDGARVTYDDQDWVYDRDLHMPVDRPVEYRQNLSTVINAIVDLGFSVRYLSDSSDMHPDATAVPGTWDHFVAFAPPWLSILAGREH